MPIFLRVKSMEPKMKRKGPRAEEELADIFKTEPTEDSIV
jgi:hypothetical protein